MNHLQSEGELKADDRMKSWEDSHHKNVRPCHCKAKMKKDKKGNSKVEMIDPNRRSSNSEICESSSHLY